MVSIANPVALYMHTFDTSTIQLDIEGTGNNTVAVPDGTFTFTRGIIDANMGLRLRIQVPNGVVGTGPSNKGRQLTVSDLWDNSTSLNTNYGAQFTDYIQMSVSGVVLTPAPKLVPQPCPGSQSAVASMAKHPETVMTNGKPKSVHKHRGRSHAW